MNDKDIQVCKGLLKMFRIDGKPADEVATLGQIEIFHTIVSCRWPRVHIETSTQYGKSLFVALGCIILSCIYGELIPVIAPTNAKADIIMRYYIQHLSDNFLFHTQLQKETNIEKLQMETSKNRVVLRNKGGIYTLSVQAGNTKKGFEAAMGEGARVVIQDESALIPDEIEATIFRMIAGKKDAVYIKIGNPFYRNHFYKSFKDLNYHKIFIDYKRGILEGRYNEMFIEEAKKKPFFSILYECEFPPEDMTDSKGYTKLFSEELLARSQRTVEMYGEKRLGCDIAEGGGDFNAEVLRAANHAKVVGKFQSSDTMNTTGLFIKDARELEVFDHNIFLDSLGVGKGSFDRMVEQHMQPFAVRFSERANDDKQFANQRAECYWTAYKWLSEGGTLEPHADWEQLSWIRYRVDSSGRILIISKDDMRKEGYPSPDIADAFVSTFARRSVLNQSREERKREKDLVRQFDAFKKKSTGRLHRQ